MEYSVYDGFHFPLHVCFFFFKKRNKTLYLVISQIWEITFLKKWRG